MNTAPSAADLVDLDALSGWMDSRDLGAGPVLHATLIAGGTQNILVRFRRGERWYVLRRPPLHKRANSDETMRREARVLGALADTSVPHPALIASCPDESVLGAAFYLMEAVDGFNATLGLPPAFADSPAMMHSVGLSMADALLALSRTDVEARRLTDLGRFEDWATRQVGRWRRQLDGYSEMEGYDGPDIPGVDAVGEWLDAHLPTNPRAGLIHGDFHFANVLVHPSEPRLAAVVDWELATIGDPLLDLGHVLSLWPGADSGIESPLASGVLPSPDELIDYYGEHTDRDLSDLLWYRVLACYRLGLILEGTHARACAGLAPVEIGDRLHATTVALLSQAMQLIES